MSAAETKLNMKDVALWATYEIQALASSVRREVATVIRSDQMGATDWDTAVASHAKRIDVLAAALMWWVQDGDGEPLLAAAPVEP